MQQIWIRWGALAALGLVTACSAAGHGSVGGSTTLTAAAPASAAAETAAASATTLSIQEAGATYLRLVVPANAALATMGAALDKLPDSATGSDVAKITDPAATAIDATCQQLLRVAWPSTVVADMKSLVTADEVTASDLRSVDGQTTLSIPSWETQIAADAGKSNAAVSIVRADLGLPAASPPA